MYMYACDRKENLAHFNLAVERLPPISEIKFPTKFSGYMVMSPQTGADPGFGKGGFYRYKNTHEILATPTLGSTTPTFD